MKKEPKKFHHLEVHPAENGFIVSHHYTGGDGGAYPSDYPRSQEQHVMESAKAVGKHVVETLGPSDNDEDDSPKRDSPKVSMAQMAKSHKSNVRQERMKD